MNVLAVVAHRDDEVLGLGGTIARHTRLGDQVSVLCVTDSGDKTGFARACTKLGASSRALGSFNDQRLHEGDVAELADAIAGAANAPDRVYLHDRGDLNSDHRIAALAALVAFRPAGHRSPELYAFETVSSSEWSPAPFAPSYFVELSTGDTTSARLALASYADEIRPRPHPRNSEGLAVSWRYRGLQAGVEFAEAFATVRAYA